jgi:hypothetical protein
MSKACPETVSGSLIFFEIKTAIDKIFNSILNQYLE